ncbi:DUF3429 domain-containing protein [Allohahella marinimesophila]|uniref:DUF3429 domain-containing protein n=1 Tax=Allohahella marinimesophila TaxID=1054972 RepID=A0ABP7PL89_9GAMM
MKAGTDATGSAADTNTYHWLGYAGLVPFVVPALAFIINGSTLWFHLFSSYSLLIMSFMAGTWWGSEIRSGAPRLGWMVLSNIIALAGWLTFAYGMTHETNPETLAMAFLLVQSGNFIVLGWLDVSGRSGLITGGYALFRLRLTIVVVLCHLFMLFA